MNAKKTIKILQRSIKACGIICGCTLLFFSCAIKKYQIATTFVDTESGEQLTDKSVGLKKGKICYITTNEDEIIMSDGTSFKDTRESHFRPLKLGSHPYSSLAGGSSTSIDTTISNRYIACITLSKVIDNNLPGFEYELVDQEKFRNKEGELCLDILKEYCNPDIIINLAKLSLNIHGNTNISSTSYSEIPLTQMTGTYSTSKGFVNFSGAILIDYSANWEIINTSEKEKHSITQKGRFVSLNREGYKLEDGITKTNLKVAEEFYQLLYKLK